MQELLKNSDARPLSLFSLSIFGPHPIGGDGKRGFAAGGFAAAQMLFIPDFTAKTHRRDAESAEFYISIISAYSAVSAMK
jgi:hypothetical protein